jgi:chaperonin GroES
MGLQTKQQLKFRPLSDRVLLQRRASETSIGGILLPDNAKKKQEAAEVIAVGPGKQGKNGELLPMPVKVGDTVLIEKYSGQEVSLEGEEYTIVRGEDIIAIIE